MPRALRKKTSDVPTRIYSYRCLPPVSEGERVEQQFQLAHQYRNALIEVERRRRDRIREVQLEDPVVGELLRFSEDADGSVDEAYNDIRAKKAGNANADLSAEQEPLEHAKELRSLFWDQLRAAKADRAEHLAPGYAQVREKAEVERKAARHDFIGRGLRTATYTRIEDAIKQASKSTQRALFFERYDGTGSIGTQLIGSDGSLRAEVDPAAAGIRGMTVSELLSCRDPRLRLGGPGEMDKHPRSEMTGITWGSVHTLHRNLRRHAARTYVDLRVGSNPDRSPIFARFPVTLHRPLPKDSVIKWAFVVRKRVGRHYEWRFQVTIESETFRPCPVPIGEGTCALDLGWRRVFDAEGVQVGLRVGYVVDGMGHEREILAPANLVSGMAKVHDLAAIRDKEFDGARNRLVEWLRGRETPEWMSERIVGLPQWRAIGKLAALIDAWTGIDWSAWRAARAAGTKCNPADFGSRSHRLDDDNEILASLQAWARQDRHLQNWEEHQRDRLLAHRRETWRVVAAELTARYATILIENGTNKDASMNLVDMESWERPAPEDGNPSDGRDQRQMSRLAAPGELRTEIVKAAVKRGAQVELAETACSTQTCAWCGCNEPFNAKSTIKHTCASCGRTWDQDANACRNLLHRNGVPSGPVPDAPAGVLVDRIAMNRQGSSGMAAGAVLDHVR